jgi:peptidoglycan/xylan/chitin deacetylase (PgdA/CDA1 family)
LMLKSFVLRAAKGTGLLTVSRRSRWRRSRLLVLCYHGVSMRDEHAWNPELYVTQTHLRRRLQWLRSHRYSILPLGAAVQQLLEGSLASNTVSITFDDGAYDFAERAVPVLAEYEVPATVYLTTYYCGRRLPVYDTALSYILWKGRDCGADLGDILAATTPVPLATESGRRLAWHLAQERVAGRDGAGKHEMLGRIAERVGVNFSDFVDSRLLQIMTPEQVRALPSDLVDVQLHTHRHRTPRAREAFSREIAENRAAVAALLGDDRKLRHFCYPSGDYAAMFLPWLREQGVETATTCIPGLASRSSNPLLLPRFIDNQLVSDLGFEAWTSGFADLLPRRNAYRLDAERE